MIRELTQNLDIISALENEPNDEGGLSASELKAKFDESGNTIKGYINGTLIPDVAVLVSDTVAAASLAAGNVPAGGAAGQVLSKRSANDYDLGFADMPTSAGTLTTPRLIQADLTSESAAGFDGSKDVMPGVTGILPAKHGGTGAASAAGAALALGRGLCVCDTAAATAAKEVTINGLALIPGAVIGVRFTYANTVASPTLNVNATGVAAIIDSVTNAAVHKSKMAARAHFFQYDGSAWILLNPTEWKYVTGIVSPPTKNASVNLGFTPNALLCQHYRTEDVYNFTSTFANLTLNVSQSAKNYNYQNHYATVTPTATGFTYSYVGANTDGTELRYVAFV